MDTVKSGRGSNKCILTIYFPQFELLLGRLMNRCTTDAVRLEFEHIQKALGNHDEFSFLFPVILTDRGGEFGDPESLEKDWDGNPRTSIFYCDPMRSNQKGGIEVQTCFKKAGKTPADISDNAHVAKRSLLTLR